MSQPSQCVFILGNGFVGQREGRWGWAGCRTFCSPTLISLLGKPGLLKFSICLHLIEASKPDWEHRDEQACPLLVLEQSF